MTDHTLYAIGDIHGHLSILDDLLARIEQDANGKPYQLLFLGDYVDRGPQSKQVIDRLIGLQQKDWVHPPVFLEGNHELSMRMMMNVKTVGTVADNWLKHGGVQTLASYGVPRPDFVVDVDVPRDIRNAVSRDFDAAVSPAHKKFLQGLSITFETATHFFCHAGIRPGVALKDQSNYDLQWIRTPFLSSEEPYEKIIVHGHTITDSHLPVVLRNRIGIDTGAYESGVLTAAVLRGDEPPRFVMTPGRR